VFEIYYIAFLGERGHRNIMDIFVKIIGEIILSPFFLSLFFEFGERGYRKYYPYSDKIFGEDNLDRDI
jgi:hypothetical protein